MLLQTSPMFYSFSLCPGGQTLKQQTCYIWSLWCFDEIAHTPSLFSTSFSTVSYSPDDCAPSVSTTLGYRALASEESVHLCQATWCGCGRGRRQPSSCASEWPSLWVTPPRELLLTASLFLCLVVAPMEPPAVTMPGGSVCLIPLPNTKRGVRGEKINSSLNKFVKSASKGFNICFGTAVRLTWPWECDASPDKLHACRWGRRCCYCLTLDWKISHGSQCKSIGRCLTVWGWSVCTIKTELENLFLKHKETICTYLCRFHPMFGVKSISLQVYMYISL